MKKYISLCFLAPGLWLSVGCQNAGYPRQSYDPKRQITQLEKIYEKPSLIPDYYTLLTKPEASDEAKKAARNNIIDGRLALINLNYNQFVAKFSVTKQTLDFSTEVTELGLNLATTAAGGATTKTILGAISSGVTGTKLALDKNFFFEKTVPVLVTTMNAQRKVALVPILVGMTNSITVYPLTQALSDIDAYYFAGTFIGALQTIQAESGAKDKQADREIKEVRDKEFTSEAVQNRVSALLQSIDTLSDDAAIELAKNPPVESSPDVTKVVELRDPTKKRFTSGAAAKQIIKMEISLGDRNTQSLAAWEAAVKANQ